MFIARDAPKVWHSVIVCRENILLPFPLGNLSVLWVSVVKLLTETLTTDTEDTEAAQRKTRNTFSRQALTECVTLGWRHAGNRLGRGSTIQLL